MADLDTNIEQIQQGQAQKEVTANGLIDAASPAAIFGRHAEACSGLTWGYYGGRWGGAEIANGTVLLPGAATSRLVVDRSSGAVLLDTDSDAFWADTEGFAHLYEIDTTGVAVSDYRDHRCGPGGLYGAAGGLSVEAGSDGVSAGDILYYNGSAWAVVPAGSDGQVLTTHAGSDPPTWEDAAALVDIQLAVSDLIANLVAGTSKAFTRAPRAFTLTRVRAALVAASSSGAVTVDINVNGSTILSTKLTIDASEKTSTTAATPYVFSAGASVAIADDDEILIDVDGAGTSARGLVVTLSGTA
jgi:hypothetical protein